MNKHTNLISTIAYLWHYSFYCGSVESYKINLFHSILEKNMQQEILQ